MDDLTNQYLPDTPGQPGCRHCGADVIDSNPYVTRWACGTVVDIEKPDEFRALKCKMREEGIQRALRKLERDINPSRI